MTRFTLVLILLFAMQSAAQTSGFIYQGSLNTGGTPANGNHDFEFAIFDSVAAGSQVGSTISRTNVPVTNGVFSVLLDFGTVPFTGPARFLEVRVRTSGGGTFTPLLPRQGVHSSPYAMKSTDTTALAGQPASAYVLSGASVINAATQFNLGGQRVLSISGSLNVFVGANAGSINTGSNNSFVGAIAGQNNTTGSSNAFFGTGAGTENVDGSDNSFFGVNTGRATISGSRNTFMGRLAGRFNTTGTDNTFAGFNAGAAGAGASFNTAFGSAAGQNTTSSNNAFFGGEAGAANTNGTGNSFFGRLAGSDNTIGDNNTFLGRTAGNTNTAGTDNTIVGSLADVGANNLTNATAIGARALATQSNSLILGSIDGVNTATVNTNVGIGTTAPINRLTIGQPDTPIINGRVGVFNAGNAYSIVRDTTNDVEALVGADSNGAIFGAMSDHEVLFRGNNVTRMRIRTDGQAVFSERATFVKGLTVFQPLHLGNGSFTLEGNESLCYVFISNMPTETVIRPSICTSKAKFKENVNPLKSGLDLVGKLRPVSFKWKASGQDDIGLIAEEVDATEPLLISRDNKGEALGVRYDRLGVVMINAVKEQQAQIESLQKQIADQNATINSLKFALCELHPELAVCKGDPK